MCMNCGCQRPNDDRGNPANVTLDDIERAARANGQSVRQALDTIVATFEARERRTTGPSREGLARPGGPERPGPAPPGTPATES